MSYEEYRNLPWEVDVQNRETKVLQINQAITHLDKLVLVAMLMK